MNVNQSRGCYINQRWMLYDKPYFSRTAFDFLFSADPIFIPEVLSLVPINSIRQYASPSFYEIKIFLQYRFLGLETTGMDMRKIYTSKHQAHYINVESKFNGWFCLVEANVEFFSKISVVTDACEQFRYSIPVFKCQTAFQSFVISCQININYTTILRDLHKHRELYDFWYC